MRFRPANIRLINRRNYLPRLLLALSSNSDKSKDNDKNHPINVQRLTGHSISELQVTRKGEDKEHVEMGFPAIYRFDIEKRGGRWLIVAFSE
jgi:hypothetical protein